MPAHRRDRLEHLARYLLRPPLALERLTETSGGHLLPTAAAGDGLRGKVPSDPERSRAPGRLSWATLLRRVFAIEVLVCPRCAGPRRIVGAVTEPHAVRRRLAALGFAPEPPPVPAPLVAIR